MTDTQTTETEEKRLSFTKRRFSYYELPPHTIGERIRWERHKRGMTQKQLSEKLDISPSYLGALERGSRPISASISSKIHRFLDISYDYLLEGEGVPPSSYPLTVREAEQDNAYDEISHILKTCTTEELNTCCCLIKTYLTSLRKQHFEILTAQRASANREKSYTTNES